MADPTLRLAAQRAGRHREGWVCVSHLFSHPVHLVIHVCVRKVHKLQFCPFFYCEDIYKLTLVEMRPVTLPSFIGMLTNSA